MILRHKATRDVPALSAVTTKTKASKPTTASATEATPLRMFTEQGLPRESLICVIPGCYTKRCFTMRLS